MAQYTIYGIATISKVLGVIEAETKEDAVEIAWADDMICEEMYFSQPAGCEGDVGDIFKLEAEKA